MPETREEPVSHKVHGDLHQSRMADEEGIKTPSMNEDCIVGVTQEKKKTCLLRELEELREEEE
ncbi:hypothetical protein GJ744_005762 [Endocarpon pusillum]|uniref:Uncharacterized protein n=1 Tax=Endocarpon pusillum TaxID=364733 RepID=A0A8H7AMW5_9EURO|nr:hypothetical protein GJ744_005762 [Endocarpon pusillum]